MRIGKQWFIVAVAVLLSSFVIRAAAGDFADVLKKAQAGDATTQVALGLKYLEGQGVPKDEAESFKWFRKAADQGNADGQNMVGAMYADGLGVPKDETEAVKWYRKSAEFRVPNAKATSPRPSPPAEREGNFGDARPSR